jgi:hypothetical protein
MNYLNVCFAPLKAQQRHIATVSCSLLPESARNEHSPNLIKLVRFAQVKTEIEFD